MSKLHRRADSRVIFTSTQRANSALPSEAGVTCDDSPKFIGLRQSDRDGTFFAGRTLSIAKWAAGVPGDYIHVSTMTAVPEPAIHGLMLAGLAALGFTLHRRGCA